MISTLSGAFSFATLLLKHLLSFLAFRCCLAPNFTLMPSDTIQVFLFDAF